MLSATSEYALRAALVLAREFGRRPMRADEIADAVGAPRNYMAKTLNALVKAEVAVSARGPFGGFQLALPPHELTIAEVIDCFDEPPREQRCLLGDSYCNPRVPCAAHYRWTAITVARREPLATTTLADLLGESAPVVAPTNERNEDHVHSAY
jgi:Rrf2 family transcriptional regulator, iron-sulfur cluster assembly transcription factor